MLVSVLRTYVVQHHFVLAGAFGNSPDDAHFYYVRPGCVGFKSIVEGIHTIRYQWSADGSVASNMASAWSTTTPGQ